MNTARILGTNSWLRPTVLMLVFDQQNSLLLTQSAKDKSGYTWTPPQEGVEEEDGGDHQRTALRCLTCEELTFHEDDLTFLGHVHTEAQKKRGRGLPEGCVGKHYHVLVYRSSHDKPKIRATEEVTGCIFSPSWLGLLRLVPSMQKQKLLARSILKAQQFDIGDRWTATELESAMEYAERGFGL